MHIENGKAIIKPHCIYQEALMLFDPADGKERPYPSNASQYRKFHKQLAWIYNPWTGLLRSSQEIAADLYGLLLISDE